MTQRFTFLPVVCLVLAALAVAPGTAAASCAHALGMLRSQVALIEAAEPLAQDREAEPGPADHYVSDTKPELVERTRLAAGGLADDRSRPANTAAHAAAMAEARTAIDNAQTALNAGDEAGCQDAVTAGLDAVRQARFSL